jgi:hypothetical protein
MASLSFPPLLTPVMPAIPAGSSLPVGPVAAVAPAALLAEMDNLPLPLPGASPPAPPPTVRLPIPCRKAPRCGRTSWRWRAS